MVCLRRLKLRLQWLERSTEKAWVQSNGSEHIDRVMQQTVYIFLLTTDHINVSFSYFKPTVFHYFSNFSASVVLFLAISPLHTVIVGKFGQANCGMGCKQAILDNLTHGRMVLPSERPARQCSNISAMVSWRTMCKQQWRVPARQTGSESVCGIGVGILVCEERWAANMRTDARAGGYGVRVGTDHKRQTTDSLWKHFVPYPEGSWAHEGGRKEEAGGLHKLMSSWLTHTHPHTDAVDSQVICLVTEEV